MQAYRVGLYVLRLALSTCVLCYSEYLIHSIGIYFVFVMNKSDARNWVLVIHFNSVLKRVKLCRCTIIYLPNSTLNANLTTANHFFTKDDWRCGRFENFESDHHYESIPESEVRFEIESNLEASQVPTNFSRSHCNFSRSTSTCPAGPRSSATVAAAPSTGLSLPPATICAHVLSSANYAATSM